jgi:hypothetical protein
MSQPWSKAGPAGFDFAAHHGQLCFIFVGGCHPPRNTQFGMRSGVRCTLVFLDGPNPGEELYSVLLWGQRIVARLRNCAGQILLHRLVEGQGTGANKPNDLADPTPADEQMALAWANYYPGRLDHLLRDAIQDFEVQEHALQVQERGQSQGGQAQGGAARPQAQPQAQPQYQQPAQPAPQWQLNNQHQPVQPQYAQQQPPAQPQYAQPQPAQQYQQPAQQPPAQPQYAQPQSAQPQYAQPQYAQQPPTYNGPPPPNAQPSAQQQPSAQSPGAPTQQGPPWQSAVVPGGVPATPGEAGF